MSGNGPGTSVPTPYMISASARIPVPPRAVAFAAARSAAQTPENVYRQVTGHAAVRPPSPSQIGAALAVPSAADRLGRSVREQSGNRLSQVRLSRVTGSADPATDGVPAVASCPRR